MTVQCIRSVLKMAKAERKWCTEISYCPATSYLFKSHQYKLLSSKKTLQLPQRPSPDLHMDSNKSSQRTATHQTMTTMATTSGTSSLFWEDDKGRLHSSPWRSPFNLNQIFTTKKRIYHYRAKRIYHYKAKRICHYGAKRTCQGKSGALNLTLEGQGVVSWRLTFQLWTRVRMIW